MIVYLVAFFTYKSRAPPPTSRSSHFLYSIHFLLLLLSMGLGRENALLESAEEGRWRQDLAFAAATATEGGGLAGAGPFGRRGPWRLLRGGRATRFSQPAHSPFGRQPQETWPGRKEGAHDPRLMAPRGVPPAGPGRMDTAHGRRGLSDRAGRARPHGGRCRRCCCCGGGGQC